MIDLDLRSRVPIYEQLVDKLKRLMLTGVLKTDEQLPSVRQLATSLTINPNTIQKAYRELEQQGYIYSLPGKGSFVAGLRAQDSGRLKALEDQLRPLLTEALCVGLSRERLLEIFEESEVTIRGED